MPRNQHVESEPANNFAPDEAEASTSFVILTELIKKLIARPSCEKVILAKEKIQEKTLPMRFEMDVEFHRGSANLLPDLWRRAKNSKRTRSSRVKYGVAIVPAALFVSTNAFAVAVPGYTVGLPDTLLYFPLRTIYNNRDPNQAVKRAKRTEIKDLLSKIFEALDIQVDLYNDIRLGDYNYIQYSQIKERYNRFPDDWPTLGRFIDEMYAFLSIIKGRNEGYFDITHDLNVTKVFKLIVNRLKCLENSRDEKMYFLKDWSGLVNPDLLLIQEWYMSEKVQINEDTIDCHKLCLRRLRLNFELFLKHLPPKVHGITLNCRDVKKLPLEQKERLLIRFPMHSSNITLVDSTGRNKGIIEAKRIRLLGFLLGIMRRRMKKNGEISDFSYLPLEILAYIAHIVVEAMKNTNGKTHSQHSTARSADISHGYHVLTSGHQQQDKQPENHSFPGFYTIFGEGYRKANQINDEANLNGANKCIV